MGVKFMGYDEVKMRRGIKIRFMFLVFVEYFIFYCDWEYREGE